MDYAIIGLIVSGVLFTLLIVLGIVELCWSLLHFIDDREYEASLIFGKICNLIDMDGDWVFFYILGCIIIPLIWPLALLVLLIILMCYILRHIMRKIKEERDKEEEADVDK